MTAVSGWSDAALARAAARGDRAAFAEIYDRYAAHVVDLCTAVLRDRTDAADAAQETFLIAAQRLAQLRDPAKVRAWLFAIARHEALRLARARSRVRPAEEVAEVPEPAGDPARPAEDAELRRMVQAVAAGLDDRDRTVLNLHLRRGLEGRELADVLGVTERHAWVIMHRVRARFERALGAWLVARRGSADCARLREVLAGWDGRFSPLVRKRVARHVDHCDVCAGTKARLASPAALLARMPLAAAPLGLRERVLDQIVLTGHGSAPPPGWRDGFPPPLYPSRGRRAGAVAAVTLLVLGGLGWYGAHWYGGDVEPSPDAHPAGASTAAPAPTPAPRSPDPVGPTPGSPPTSAATGTPTGEPTGTGPPADPLPAIGTVTAEPGEIQREQSGCPGVATEAAVLVEVVEHTLVSFVHLHWSVAGEEGTIGSLPRVGTSDIRRAGIGPFNDNTLPPAGSDEAVIELRVEIIDSHGRTVSHDLPDGTLTLVDCTFG